MGGAVGPRLPPEMLIRGACSQL